MQKRNAIKKWAVICVVAGLVACGSAEERKTKYMQQGMDLFEEGRYEKAILAFKNVLQIDPKDSASRYQLAETLSKQGEIRKAFKHYYSIASSDDTHVMSRVRVGQLYVMSRNVEKAEEMMQEAIVLAPDDSEVLVFQATINLIKNNIDEATKNVEKALEKDPDSPPVLVMRASIYAKTGDIEQAIDVLKQGVVNTPDDESMHLMLAKLYDNQQLKGDVERELKTLVKIRPDSLKQYKRLVAFYLADKQAEKAESVLRDALKQIPEEQVQFYLIDFLNQQQGIDKAINELLTLIKQSPEAYGLRFKLASLQIKKDDLVTAEATFKEIVELDKLGAAGIKARNGLARLYAATKRVDEATELVKVVLEENPRDAQALTLRGQFSFADNKITDAIADFRSALVGQPEDTKLLKLLSAAQLANSEIELALENMQKVVLIAPNDVLAKQGVVEILFRSGKPLQAEGDILAILKLEPKNKKALESLFKIRMHQKDWSKAQQVSNQVRTLAEDPAKGYYLSGRAYQAEKKWQESIEAYKQVLLVKPGAVEPLTKMVKSYLLLDQSANALSFLNDVIKNQKDHFVAYNLMGEVLLRDKKIADAGKAFRQAIDIKPEWSGAYRNLALVSLVNKDTASAISVLKEGVEKTNGSIKLIDLLVSVYKKEGESNKIIELYEQAYKQYPDSTIVINNLASYLAEYGGTQETLDRAEKLAVSLESSKNANILDTAGWIAFKQGKYDKAQDILESAIELGANAAEINYHIGMVYNKKGEDALAQKYLEKAILKAPDYKGLEQAKEVLQRIKTSG